MQASVSTEQPSEAGPHACWEPTTGQDSVHGQRCPYMPTEQLRAASIQLVPNPGPWHTLSHPPRPIPSTAGGHRYIVNLRKERWDQSGVRKADHQCVICPQPRPLPAVWPSAVAPPSQGAPSPARLPLSPVPPRARPSAFQTQTQHTSLMAPNQIIRTISIPGC